MATYLAGYNAKIRINSTAYTVASYQAADDTPENDVSNTEAIPGNPAAPSNLAIWTNNNNTTLQGSSFIPGLSKLTATLHQATFDTTVNIFSAPLNINAGNYVSLVIYMDRVGSTFNWTSTSFLITRTSQEGQIRGLQPVTFQGVGDGLYT